MTFRKKILLFLCITFALFLASVTGTIVYFYYQPHKIKGLIERTLSASTGTYFAIEELAYSIKPLKIHVKGITANPARDQHGFSLEIPEVIGNMALVGPFGRRTLSIESITIPSFSAHLARQMALPDTVSRVQAPSYIARVLKRMVAFFLFREVKVLGVAVSHGEISLESEGQRVDVGGIRARLAPDHALDISCSVQVEWPQEKMRFNASRLSLATNQAVSVIEPKIEALLRVQGATFQHAQVSTGNIAGQVTVSYDHMEKCVAFDSVDFRSERITLTQEAHATPVSSDLRLTARGLISLENNQAHVSRFRLLEQDLLELNGALEVSFGAQNVVRLQGLDGHLMTQRLPTLLATVIGDKSVPFSLSGPLNFRGDIQGTNNKHEWHWLGDLEAKVTGNRFSYSNGQMQLNSTITGTMRAEGAFPGAKISCRLEGKEAAFLGKGVALKSSRARFSLSGIYPSFVIEEVAAQVPQATFKTEEKEIHVNDIEVYLQKGGFDAEKWSVALPEVKVDSSLLRNLKLSVQTNGNQATMTVRGEDIHLIASAAELELLPSGWQFNSIDSLELKTTLHRNQRCTMTAKLDLMDLAFHNQDETLLAEKLHVRAETSAELRLSGLYGTADAKLVIDNGEVLYDRFYLDLKNNPLSTSFMGTYDIFERSCRLLSLRLGLKDILGADIHGTVFQKDQHAGGDLSVKLDKTALSPVFQHFVLEPFKTEAPFLSSVHVGGTILADLKLTGIDPNWVIRGNIAWQEGQFSSDDDGIAFHGMDLDLPVWYQTGSATNGDGSATGELSIASMMLPPLPQQSIHVSIHAGPNRLSVHSPTNLKIPGGDLQIGPILCRVISGEPPLVETSLTLSNVQIGPLLSVFWSQPMKGTIDGKLDPVRFEGGNVTSEGEIRAGVLSGEIILSGVAASGLFTPGPVLKLSAQCKDLNLADLTTGTSFGKVEGILHGRVEGLEIAYGQPQKFDLLFETFRTKGISQKISVKAVENISHIGGGQSPFMGLAGSFASMFRNFPYKKIGVRASLENDVFRINGTVKEGGKEYLVKRGGIFGVDVINQKPDNRVSFKDMIKRIKRVTASKSGPVVR